MIIGIPRGLIYFKKPQFWEIFFNNLGFEVALSPVTNKQIVESGVKVGDPETCFSNKVYWGHLMWLDGKCDLIFVPRLKTNHEKLEYCPKFFALPDLAKIMIKTPILTGTFDERKESFIESLEDLGKKLDKSPWEVQESYEFAVSKTKELEEKERQGFLARLSSDKPKILLISHPYNLFDSYVNLRTEEKLKKLGVEPIFIDELDDGDRAPDVNFHWEFGREIVGKIAGALKDNIVGAIQISSFQCGCDAVLKEFVEREFKLKKIPFLYIIIDEHTGEAGLQTRLEAFVDTL